MLPQNKTPYRIVSKDSAMDINTINYDKLYTIREVAQILDMCQETLSQWSCKGFIDAIKAKGQKTLIKGEIVKNMLEDKKFIQNAYTTVEAARIIGVSRNCITANIRKGFIKNYKKIYNAYYIPKDEVSAYAKNPMAYLKNEAIDTKFYSSSQVAKELNINLNTFTNWARSGFIQTYSVKSRLYISEKEFDRLKVQEDFKKNSYTSSQIANMFGYAKDAKIDNILSHVAPIKTQSICGIKYFEKAPIDRFFDRVKNDYYSIEEVSELFNISLDRIYYMNSKKIFEQPLKVGKKVFISKELVDQIKKEEEESLTYEDVKEQYNISLSSIYSLISRNNDIITFRSKLDGRIRILKKSFESYVQKIYKNRMQKKQIDPYALLVERLTLLSDTKWQNTYALCQEWSIQRLNNLAISQRKIYSQQISDLTKKLLEYLSCELYDCSDEEIKIFSASLPISGIKHMPSLLDFCKMRCREKCKFQISIRSPRKKTVKYNSDTNASMKKEIYSRDEWFKYLSILEDIDRHIGKAFADYRYTSVWAYSLLHFSLSWRKSDMIRIPNIDLEEIGVCSFEWFRNGNPFTLTLAEKIVQQLVFKTRGMKPQKRGKNGKMDLIFTVGKYQRIPLTIALVILEIHRRNQNKERLFEIINSTVPNASDYKKLFEPEKIPPLSNRKCNKSLLTFCVEHANKKEGSKLLAYMLGTASRSHDPKKGQELALMTRLYIQDTTNEGSINHIVYNQCRRGHFGVSFYLLLSIAYDLKDWTIEEVTTVIEKLNRQYTPMGIETVAEFLLYKRQEMENVFKELIISPSENIRQLLDAIIHGKRPSKLNYVSCLKGYKHCPFKYNYSFALFKLHASITSIKAQ
ncbi:helix-turn-helix domain-containing protein [Petroclostridium sp. X23]|uniref:helix-turn-helix domain-containing protein n=1 Tax=Petroclostridium sp. X23 TaxID=3045146 RepID=UPI0024AD634C|nr:helix-turn-helix domain-containing protein [Petroclostridium sp. X23]WHH58843.1 helix-turn-helix domain-containing protein [Petroclostridium sp. X23]